MEINNDNKAIDYYQNNIHNLIEKNIFLNKNSRIYSLQYDKCFKSIIDREIIQLKTKTKLISLDELHSSKYIKNSRQESLSKNLLKTIFSWCIFLIISLKCMGLDLLIDLSYKTFKYKLSLKDAKLITGKLQPNTRQKSKYKKLSQIIIIEDFSQLKEDDLNYLRYIIFLIKNRYVVNTAVIVFSSIEIFELDCVKENLQINLDDLRKIYNYDIFNIKNIELFRNLDIKYHAKLFDVCNESVSSIKENKLILEKILYNIIDNASCNISQDEIFRFLKLCSYLFPEFSQRDIETNQFIALSSVIDCLNEVEKTFIINKSLFNKYSFSEQYIRYFFENNVDNILTATQKDRLLIYLSQSYYLQYYNLALATIKLTDNDGLIKSQLLIAYYHKENLSLKEIKDIEKHLSNIININLLKNTNLSGKKCDFLFSDINNELLCEFFSELNSEGQLALLGLVLPIAYEFNTDNEKLIDKYIQCFASIHDLLQQAKRYNKYIIDFIILSTALNQIDMRKRKVVDTLLAFLNRNQNEIQYYDRLRLWRFSNYIEEEPEVHLKEGYNLTQNEPFEHELFRINYSVALLFSKKYDQAYKLFGEKNRLNLLSVDFDCFLSYENNRIISKYAKDNFKKISKNDFNHLEKTIRRKNFHSDLFIIKNNKIACDILLRRFNYNKSLDIISKIINTKDEYHIFFLTYNLLVYAFINKDKKLFEDYYYKFKIPLLLQKYSSYFKDKIEIFKNNLFSNDIIKISDVERQIIILNKKYSDLRIGIYGFIVLFGVIERWYE